MAKLKLQRLGYVLFVTGMMVAALFAAKPVEDSADASEQTSSAFPDTWPLCVVGLLGGAVGAGLIRHGAIAGETTKQVGKPRPDPSVESVVAVDSHSDQLLAMIATIDKINSASGDQNSPTFRAAIDRLLIDQVAIFSAQQTRLNAEFGMTRGAEILVACAVGERMLNRAWSTSADGYATEASRSLAEARQAFEQAANLCADSPMN